MHCAYSLTAVKVVDLTLLQNARPHLRSWRCVLRNPAPQCPRMLFLLSVEPSKSHIFHLHVNVFSLKCRQNLLHTCILFTLENIIDADDYNLN